VLELVQCTEGLMEAAGTVSFLGALGHHTGLEQGYIQGLLQQALSSGSGAEHCGPPGAPKFPHLRCTCTHMAHSLGFLDLSDSPTTQVTGENGRVPNLQGSVLPHANRPGITAIELNHALNA